MGQYVVSNNSYVHNSFGTDRNELPAQPLQEPPTQHGLNLKRRKFLISGGIVTVVLIAGAVVEGVRKLVLGPTSFSSLLYQQSLGMAINTLEYAPGGSYLAAARGNQTAQIISASTGMPFVIYRQHRGNVNAVTWEKDGVRLASASSDKTAQVWQADGKQLRIYKGHADIVTCVAWSPDGGKIASTSYDKTIQVWDPSSGNRFVTCQGHTQKIWWVAWSPDNRRLVSGSEEGTVRLWDASTGESIGKPYTGHRGPVFTVRWSMDGNYVASAGQDSDLRIWNPRTNQDITVCRGHTQPIRDLAWSPDNTHLVSGSEDQTIHIWAVGTQQPLATYQNSPNSAAILACVYSRDGNQISTGNYAGALQIWQKNQC